jgi:hypothetical protein
MGRIAEPPASQIQGKKRHRKLWLILVFLVLPVLLFCPLHLGNPALCLLLRRACRLCAEDFQKGWICKTWEGELAMTTVPGVAPQIWQFTVRGC